MATVVKRPSGKWQATVRRDGRSQSRTFSKRSDALKWARQTEVRAELEGSLKPAAIQPVMGKTLGEALVAFRDRVVPTHRSAANETCSINAMLRRDAWLTRTPLDALTADAVVRWRDRRLKEVAPGTVIRELTLLQSAVECALEAGSANVVRQVRRPRVYGRRERRLLPGEWDALMHACGVDRNKLLRPLLVLAIETAMRRGELLSTEWKHFDPTRFTIFLARTKNGHPRTVPLSPLAMQTLAGLPRTHDRILPLSGDCVRQGFERLRARAALEDIRFHDLRHEAVSRLVERGLSLLEVQRISGHRSLQMLQRYTHLQTADIVAKLHGF